MRKILNQLDSLETVLPVEFADFLTFLRAFKKVRDAAFNSVSYDRNCPIYINEVVTSLEALKQFGVTFIPKFHLLHHVATFCEKQDAPLGLYGDQGVERVHQVYEKVWNRFKVNSTDKLILGMRSLGKTQKRTAGGSVFACLVTFLTRRM